MIISLSAHTTANVKAVFGVATASIIDHRYIAGKRRSASQFSSSRKLLRKVVRRKARHTHLPSCMHIVSQRSGKLKPQIMSNCMRRVHLRVQVDHVPRTVGIISSVGWIVLSGSHRCTLWSTVHNWRLWKL